MSDEKIRSEITKNVNMVRQKISNACSRSGRNVSHVRLVAVSKTVPAEKIRAAVQAGVTDFGENYAQEAIAKMDDLADLRANTTDVADKASDVVGKTVAINWHFIGALQSNKVKQIHDRFSLIHAIDRVSTIGEISKRSRRPQSILIEVNLADEATKSGVRVNELPQLLEAAQAQANVRLNGLMFMPPLDLPADEQRRYFNKARLLRDRMVTNVSAPHNLGELSMGTSHDFEIAVEEGATLVRIGSALFGARPHAR